MSHHHMLPPIIYEPQPKLKKIEPKKSRIQMRGAGALEDADEAGGIFDAGEHGPSAPADQKPPLPNFVPIEGADQKPHQPRGRLSENTLKVMLQVQELGQAKIA
jgi:hypothetical protein